MLVPSGGATWVAVNGAGVPSADKTSASVTLSMIGPFVDWYFWPTDGWHAEAAPCFASLTVNRQNDPKTFASGSGFGFVVGGGYEWWIGEQWSLGVLARVQVAFPSVTGEDTNTYGSTVVVPTLAMSATYH
jgi:hypothetical protein